jgi:hypothetical protein
VKRQKTNIFVLSIVAIIGVLLASPVRAATLDIDGICMDSCKYHWNGTADSYPWALEISVYFADTGDLKHIDITKPGGSTPFTTIYEDYGDWEYESPSHYLTLADLQGNYPTGDYTFKFFDISDTLLRTVTLGYSGIDEPGDFVHITSPTHLATDVSIDPTFTWTVDAGAGDALGMWVCDADTEEDVYWNDPVPMDTPDWTPGTLLPSHEYGLEVSVFNIKDLEPGPVLPTKNVEGDDFVYDLEIEYYNDVHFTTVPEPATICLLGFGALSLIRRKR